MVSGLAKEKSTQIMKAETEIQAVNPKDSMLMIPKDGGVLSKTNQLDVLPEQKTSKR
jgi:hypothetical protein